MNTFQIIEELTKHGGRIAIDGDKLKLTAPAPLPDNLIKEIQREKPNLIAELKRLPHGECVECRKDTQSMLTKPNSTWVWMCPHCFDHEIAQLIKPRKSEGGIS